MAHYPEWATGVYPMSMPYAELTMAAMRAKTPEQQKDCVHRWCDLRILDINLAFRMLKLHGYNYWRTQLILRAEMSRSAGWQVWIIREGEVATPLHCAATFLSVA